jgi:hypothetical protein
LPELVAAIFLFVGAPVRLTCVKQDARDWIPLIGLLKFLGCGFEVALRKRSFAFHVSAFGRISRQRGSRGLQLLLGAAYLCLQLLNKLFGDFAHARLRRLLEELAVVLERYLEVFQLGILATLVPAPICLRDVEEHHWLLGDFVGHPKALGRHCEVALFERL